MSKVLDHRNYFKVAEGNLEHVRGDIWDVNWSQWPTALYNPGYELIKVRLISVTPGVQYTYQNLTKDVHGHEVNSPGARGKSAASCTYNFNDREDLAITYMIREYLNQSSDNDTGFGRHKSELVMESELTFYNTILQPTRSIKYYSGLYESDTVPVDTSERGTGDHSTVSLTVKYQHTSFEIL